MDLYGPKGWKKQLYDTLFYRASGEHACVAYKNEDNKEVISIKIDYSLPLQFLFKVILVTGNGNTEVMIDRKKWKELKYKNTPVRVPLEHERIGLMRKVAMRGAVLDNTFYIAGCI